MQRMIDFNSKALVELIEIIELEKNEENKEETLEKNHQFN
jgi:hypothetical protein